jgi:hypothetical protein
MKPPWPITPTPASDDGDVPFGTMPAPSTRETSCNFLLAPPEQSSQAALGQSGHADGWRRARRASRNSLPKKHRAKLHLTNLIERLNGEIKRRTDIVGILRNDKAIRRVGALLLERNDVWAMQRVR